MNDIVARLRAFGEWRRCHIHDWPEDSVADNAPFKAADEIERLRAALHKINELPAFINTGSYDHDDVCALARRLRYARAVASAALSPPAKEEPK